MSKSQINYFHPQAEAIKAETLEILMHSPRAKALYEEINPAIHILKGPLPQAFVHAAKTIYVRVPALQSKGRLEQALDLSGALIELKINKPLPPLDPATLESDETLVQQHYKNVSIYMKVFPIAEELDEAGHKALKEIRLMGLGKLYQAWKTGADLKECANIYWSIFDTDNESNEG